MEEGGGGEVVLAPLRVFVLERSIAVQAFRGEVQVGWVTLAGTITSSVSYNQVCLSIWGNSWLAECESMSRC